MLKWGGVTREVKEGYACVGGVVRQFYAGDLVLYDNGKNPSGLVGANDLINGKTDFEETCIYVKEPMQAAGGYLYKTTKIYDFSKYSTVYMDCQLFGDYQYLLIAVLCNANNPWSYTYMPPNGCVTISQLRQTLKFDISNITSQTFFDITWRCSKNTQYFSGSAGGTAGMCGYIYKIWLE